MKFAENGVCFTLRNSAKTLLPNMNLAFKMPWEKTTFMKTTRRAAVLTVRSVSVERAVSRGELCGLEGKKKTGWHSESEEWRRSNMRVSCGEKGDKKTGAEGSKYGKEWEQERWDDWGGQEGKGKRRWMHTENFIKILLWRQID